MEGAECSVYSRSWNAKPSDSSRRNVIFFRKVCVDFALANFYPVGIVLLEKACLNKFNLELSTVNLKEFTKWMWPFLSDHSKNSSTNRPYFYEQ